MSAAISLIASYILKIMWDQELIPACGTPEITSHGVE